jgi:hypothetical protein
MPLSLQSKLQSCTRSLIASTTCAHEFVRASEYARPAFVGAG